MTALDIRWESRATLPHRYVYGWVGDIWAFTIDLGGRGPTLHPKLPGPSGARDHEGPFVSEETAQRRAGELLAEFLSQLHREEAAC
ncbi:hypothetical protein GCM10009850_047610 [Nonomuraea monospora]|uniref:Uncharacterized protein n=1 Tax=Nonomuraea monospora TaxID=568818 RepID=A0ABN3CIL9_9ACTN